jgi:hypothetical protein
MHSGSDVQDWIRNRLATFSTYVTKRVDSDFFGARMLNFSSDLIACSPKFRN